MEKWNETGGLEVYRLGVGSKHVGVHRASRNFWGVTGASWKQASPRQCVALSVGPDASLFCCDTDSERTETQLLLWSECAQVSCHMHASKCPGSFTNLRDSWRVNEKTSGSQPKCTGSVILHEAFNCGHKLFLYHDGFIYWWTTAV